MEAFLPYLPTDRRHAIASGLELPDRTFGTAMFVDISGFTPLAEGLAKALGPQRGAEELTFFLNQVYNVLIAELDRCSGSVIGFSGDAITCWFDGDDGTIGTTCALAMQDSMTQFKEIPLPTGEIIALTAKAGLAVGGVRRFAVGDTTKIDVIAGELLDEMAEAEHHATGGQVVLGPTALKSLGDRIEIEGSGDDDQQFAVAKRLNVSVEPEPWPELENGSLKDAQVQNWLLPPVFERLRSGQGEFLAELRPAVALFLRFEGLDYDGDDAVGGKLNDFVCNVQRILTEFDGTMVDITTGDKGSHFYIAFGAPTAHEDDAERAAAVALALREAADEHPDITSVEIGISRGRMRTGAYGGSTRRTYGVLGDATNLAARLMQAAGPGEILVSEFTARKIEGAFEWEDRPAIKAKGKAEPIAVKELVGYPAGQMQAGRVKRQLLPMVGREAELEAIHEKLEEGLQGRGQVIGITAPAGMGKSRLLAEVVYSSIARGLEVFRGECKSYGSTTAYLPWENVWRGFFSLDSHLSTEQQIERLGQSVEGFDALLGTRVPLLGSIFHLAIPDNDLTQTFDAKLRKTSLESLLADTVRLRARQEPFVIVLEDTHWIDPLSEDLLRVIGQAIARLPVIILLAYRLPDEGMDHPLGSLAHFTQVELSDLPAEEAGQWIALKLSQLYGAGSHAPEDFIARLIERAEGNPFYIEEVLNYLKDHDIPPEDQRALAQVELPASLHSLVLTRIDQLEEHPRTTLRVASVVGRSFTPPELSGAYPRLDEDGDTVADLGVLATREFTELEDAEKLAYLFKHSVIKEVAYESLPHGTRAGLHENFGGYLETIYAVKLDQKLDLLAYHYDLSLNEPKKREYLLRAGDAAQANYSNSAAIEYFRKLIPLVPPDEQVEILLKEGQVLELQGEWDEAHETLERGLALSQELGDSTSEAKYETAIGELYRKEGEYESAAEWLERSKSSFESLEDEAGVAQSLHFLGTLAAQQGDYERSDILYRESLEIRQSLDDRQGQASLLSNLGIIARHQGEVQLAGELFEESLELRREIGDNWAIANSLNNQSTVSQDVQDFEGAQDQLEEAVALLKEIGDRWHYANAVNNLANVARGRGAYADAWTLYEESLNINRELGDGWALSYLLEDISALSSLEGHSDRAIRLAAAASALRSSIGAPLSPKEQEDLDGHLATARSQLDKDQIEKAWGEGLAMSLDEALDYALEHPTAFRDR